MRNNVKQYDYMNLGNHLLFTRISLVRLVSNETDVTQSFFHLLINKEMINAAPRYTF